MQRERSGPKLYHTYAETNNWSQRHKFWKIHVKKPRLPNDNDINERWIKKYIPSSIRLFKGDHNNEIINHLRSLIESFELTHTFPASIIIHGPSGSGKSSLCVAFVNELSVMQQLDSAKAKIWILNLDGKTQTGDMLAEKVARFDAMDISVLKINFRIIVVDNADHILPSMQQTLKAALESCDGVNKLIFICQDTGKLISHFQAKARLLKTKRMAEVDAIPLLLTICQRERLGFERQGIRAIFADTKHVSLSVLMDKLQDVFLRFHFISEENVFRFSEGASSVIEVPSVAAIMPVSRCSICTLIPPCRHIELVQIVEKAAERRKELPIYKGGLVCPEFFRFGRCSLFNTHGRCSLSHPQNIHKVVELQRRCPQCTLVWPCLHCEYSTTRSSLLAVVSDVKARLALLKKLAVPLPPKDIIATLSVTFPDYKDILLNLKKIFSDPKVVSVLTQTENWVEDVMCLDKITYLTKRIVLASTFEELLSSPLLEDRMGNVENISV